MDGPGDQLLAGAGLARDQHGGHGLGDALDDGEDLLHLRALADDVCEGEALLERGPQVEVLVLELFPLHRLADDDLQLFDVEGLGDVVDRPRLQRLDRGPRGGVGGDHHEGNGRAAGLDVPDEVDAGAIGQHEVAQHDVRLGPRNGRMRLFERGRGLHAPPLFLEDDRQKVPQRRLVIDDQQIHSPDSIRTRGVQGLRVAGATGNDRRPPAGRRGRRRLLSPRITFGAASVRPAHGNQRCRPCQPAGGPSSSLSPS